MPRPSATGAGARWVEFLPPWDDAEPTVTDMSHLLDPPAGRHGRVVARDGHLEFEDGTRARFWGVNLVNADCCPTREEADRIAAHLAKLGFNAVRFHHMSDAGLLGDLIDPRPPRHAEARRLLDRFDYFVARLEERGIYLFFASNVHPPFSRVPGVPDAAALQEADRDFTPLTRLATALEPALQERQRAFIRLILEHRNPYTGRRYADDPAVAFFEVANENSLVDAWSPAGVNRLDRLPPYYQQRLDALWNAWARGRYGSATGALAAWGVPSRPGAAPRPANLLDAVRPGLATHDGARASAAPGTDGPAAPADRSPAATVAVLRPGRERWHVQWRWPDLPLTAGRKYRLTLDLRASEPRTVGLVLQEQGAPWRVVGPAVDLDLTRSWKTFSLTFVPGDTPHGFKLALTLGDRAGAVEVRDATLTEVPVAAGLRPGPDGSPLLPRPRADGESGQTEGMVDDYLAFLADLDRRYYGEMRAFLRGLGYRGIVIGTQAGSLPALAVQAEVGDTIDAHGYWDHPRFPARPWSPTDWRIANRPMAADPEGSTLARLAWQRVAGKPFVVSEYNHALPNEYDAEALPLLAAVAAQQDWDGVFLFHLDASPSQIAGRKSHFFDLNRQAGKLATLPLAAALYLRGDVRPEPMAAVASLPLDGLAPLHRALGRDRLPSVRAAGADPLAFLDGRVALSWSAPPGAGPRMAPASSVAGGLVRLPPAPMPERQLAWLAPGPSGGGLVRVVTGRSAALVGSLPAGDLDLGPSRVRLAAPGFGVVGVVSLDGEPLVSSRRLLLVAAGSTALPGMTWDEGRTTVRDTWRPGDSFVALPAFTVSLPGAGWTLTPLDARGRPLAPEPASGDRRPGAPRDPGSPWHLLTR